MRAGAGPQWKKAQGMDPCASFNLRRKAEPKRLRPPIRYAVWKAAISTAADWRLTLAAAGMLAS